MIQETLCYPLEEKIADSIETLKMYQPKDRPYMLAFSGGKDSCVIKELANMAGINYQAVYNPTTIDPPELVRFIKQKHPDVKFKKPPYAFWQGIVKAGLPTRRTRWCCRIFKESCNQLGDIIIIGVRAAESHARAKRWKSVSVNTETKQYSICPIVHWSDDDVWDFIKQRNLPYCSLYDKGWKRIGCIGCPMSNRQQEGLELYPAIQKQFLKGTEIYFNRRKQISQAKTYQVFNTWQEFYEWWLSDEPLPKEDECLGLLELWG